MMGRVIPLRAKSSGAPTLALHSGGVSLKARAAPAAETTRGVLAMPVGTGAWTAAAFVHICREGRREYDWREGGKARRPSGALSSAPQATYVGEGGHLCCKPGSAQNLPALQNPVCLWAST